jgi:SAM-dependent methyltransferase
MYEEYLYISPLSGIGTSKYHGMLETITNYVDPQDTLVEIGCSEGYLLKQLQERGFSRLLGFEPGPQAETAGTMGFPVRREFFSPETVGGETFDCFVLMHVFEHFSAPWLILKTLKNSLQKQGKIIIEVPDFCGFYHFHLFFFHRFFFQRLARENGLKVIEAVQKMEALRLVLVHAENSRFPEFPMQDVQQELLERSRNRLRSFEKQVLKLRDLFQRHRGETIYWWGAGSASILLLHQIPEELRKAVDLRILDGDPGKWGNGIPGTGLLVQPFRTVAGMNLNVLLIVSSFAAEIRQTMEEQAIHASTLEVFF